MKYILLLIIAINTYGLEPHFASKPSLSPDGSKLCFVYNNDIWIVNTDGGKAERITSSKGYEGNPVFSPDGKYIVYNGEKNGYYAIYKVPVTGGTAEEISKEPISIADWYGDEDALLGVKYQIGLGRTFFKIPLNGERATSLDLIGDYLSDLSNDDEYIVFARNGYYDREEYTGSQNGELYLYDFDKKRYTKLTDTPLTERYPVFSSDSKSLFYSYSDGDNFQLYKSDIDNMEKREQLTDFDKWSVRNITKARDKDIFAFELFDELWSYNYKTKKAQKVEIDINEDIYGDFNHYNTVKSMASDYTVSENGKVVAFKYKYDLFVVPKAGGEVKQITKNQPGIGTVEIMPDNKTILFTAIDKGYYKLFKTSLEDLDDIETISWSDDKWIDGILNSGDKTIITYSTWDNGYNKKAYMDKDGNITELSDEVVYSNVAIDPNGTYAFYTTTTFKNWVKHLKAYNFETEKEINLLNFNKWGGDIYLGKKNRSLFIGIGGDIARIDLTEREDFSEEKDNWEPIYKSLKKSEEKDEEEKKGSKKEEKKDSVDPIKIDPENIFYRMKKIVRKDGYNYMVGIADDSTFYYMNVYDNKKSLRKCNYFGEGDKEIIKFGKMDNSFQLQNNGSITYLSNGMLKEFNPKSKKSELIDYTLDYSYNEIELNKKAFEELWGTFGIRFYDPKMHGKDWEELYEIYSEYMNYSYTPDVLGKVGREMIGDLNASHSEFNSRSPRKEVRAIESAELGCILDFSETLGSGIKIKKVLEGSTLKRPHNIKKGDIITAIDGIEIDEDTPVENLLRNKIGKKIKLTIETGDGEKEVVVKGLSFNKQWNMNYNTWVIERTKMVDKLSDGRIGYLHIQGMDGKSYRKFLHDLWAENNEKEALIIDVRNNGGGNTHDLLIEQLTKTSYAIQSSREFGAKRGESPSNIKDLPKVILINEYSASDAEIFPQIFREFELGKIIGVATSGYVIGTRAKNLIDGSHMRMPGYGWWRMDGTNMEGNGVQPDIEVVQSLSQIVKDDDVQLKRAVKELMKQIGRKK